MGIKYFEENKGYFWGLLETRPFMRAMAGKAECLWLDGHTAEAISIYEELLALNPGDNQGIRYILSTVLLGEEDLSKYEKFATTQDPENCAVWNYNNALFAFKKYGLTKKSVDLLQIAEKQNPHVFEYFLDFNLIPDVLPQYIGRGDENEAISYVAEATNNWMNTPGALGLLFEYKLKGGELF